MSKDFILFTYDDLVYVYELMLSKGEDSGIIWLDFGFSKLFYRLTEDGSIEFSNGLKLTKVSLKLHLKHKTETVFLLDKKGIGKVCFYEDGIVYNFIKPNNKAPTVQINGINMHSTDNICPLSEARLKVSELNIFRGSILLNISTCLGYTCIAALKKGAKKVITIEKDKNILNIANINPYSVDLFKYQKEKRVESILADASLYIKSFPDLSFDFILHDPPTYALAPLLYSSSFYEELLRVLRPYGRLYHWVGKPGKRYRHLDIVSQVSKKLSRTGFNIIKFSKKTDGIIATKLH